MQARREFIDGEDYLLVRVADIDSPSLQKRYVQITPDGAKTNLPNRNAAEQSALSSYDVECNLTARVTLEWNQLVTGDLIEQRGIHGRD